MEKKTNLHSPCGDIGKSINRFGRWLDRAGYESYDPYDIWGTRYGIFSRRLYYRNAALGLPLIAPVLLMEVLCPKWRALFLPKLRYATADAQLVLAFLNLYELSRDRILLDKAKDLGKDLLESSVKGYSGHCWGYPFDWQHCEGLWKSGTPLITSTPYCFEAFVKLFDATGEEAFLDTAASIAKFVHKDLADTPTSPDAAAASYSPRDQSHVINASAYRAMVMLEAAHRFGNLQYRQTAERNVNFILQAQRGDGAWLYGLNLPAERFIDHFHTVFVLKNLVKLNRRLNSPSVAQAVSKGYDYYSRELFTPDGLPKSFAVKPRAQIVELELYNFAEGITLGALLRNDIPEAFELALRLANVVCKEYQLPDGYFVTRIYAGGLKHKLPFLRWPQAQLFYSLTNVLLASRQNASPPLSFFSADGRKKACYDVTSPAK